MHPILFKIGGLSIYTHGVLAVIGILAGVFLLDLFARRSDLKFNFLIDSIIYSVLAGIVFARLTYYILYNSQFSTFREVFYLWQGGMVSYGGFIAGALMFAVLMRINRQPVSRWLDIGGIAFLIGLIFGRLGNVFAGEYSGIISDSKIAVDGVIPVTLLEAAFLIIVSALMLALFFKTKLRQIPGMLFTFSLFLYGGGRFIIDFWRDEKSLALGISLGQYVSLALCFLAVVWFIFVLRREQHEIIR